MELEYPENVKNSLNGSIIGSVKSMDKITFHSPFCHFYPFLAHLSRRLTGELIGYPWIRRPSSVRPIMKTNPCNEHPLTPHLYIVKLGFTGVFIFFLFCSKT